MRSSEEMTRLRVKPSASGSHARARTGRPRVLQLEAAGLDGDHLQDRQLLRELLGLLRLTRVASSGCTLIAQLERATSSTRLLNGEAGDISAHDELERVSQVALAAECRQVEPVEAREGSRERALAAGQHV
jgi:hypothetical protein